MTRSVGKDEAVAVAGDIAVVEQSQTEVYRSVHTRRFEGRLDGAADVVDGVGGVRKVRTDPFEDDTTVSVFCHVFLTSAVLSKALPLCDKHS